MLWSAVLCGLAAIQTLTLFDHVSGQNVESRSSESIEVSGKTMGPIKWRVVVAQPPAGSDQSNTQAAVQSSLDRVNGLMSTYLPDSDISRFNRTEETTWQTVDVETATVIKRSLGISELTNGAFDITVAPAVNLWQFGPGKSKAFEPPTDQQIAEIEPRVGYRQLAVRLDPPAIKKSNPLLAIDLSAIAKGYAVDQVAKTLAGMGFENFMVEVGGEVVTRGVRAGGGPWRIGIESPDEFSQTPARVAEMQDRAMATSGDYRNYEVVRGKRYSHTINPTTCRPVEHALATACVIANDCMTADAMATAVMVVGSEQGMKLCRDNGMELLTFARDSDFGDTLTEDVTDRFPFGLLQPTLAVAHSSSSELEVGREPSSESGTSDTERLVRAIWPAFVGAVVIITLAILGMAVGAIFGNKPVQGSCGGLANMPNDDGESSCSVCAKPTSDCVEKGNRSPG
jgi:thiamine biosynthesis lipoprotein